MKKANDRSFDKFLKPTKLINSDHPDIVKQSIELASGVRRAEDKSRNIFYFIRDQIEYIHHYGLYADVTFIDIISWLKEGYPHLVESLSEKVSS